MTPAFRENLGLGLGLLGTGLAAYGAFAGPGKPKNPKRWQDFRKEYDAKEQALDAQRDLEIKQKFPKYYRLGQQLDDARAEKYTYLDMDYIDEGHPLWPKYEKAYDKVRDLEVKYWNAEDKYGPQGLTAIKDKYQKLKDENHQAYLKEVDTFNGLGEAKSIGAMLGGLGLIGVGGKLLSKTAALTRIHNEVPIASGSDLIYAANKLVNGVKKVASEKSKEKSPSLSRILSKGVYMAFPNSPKELAIPVTGASIGLGSMLVNDKVVRPRANKLNATARALDKDRFIALANRQTPGNADFIESLNSRITAHNKQIARTQKLNKAMNLAGYAGLGITIAGIPAYHYLKRNLNQRTKTAADVHTKSGVSDDDFNRYNTLVYRSNLARKGSAALAATALGSRLFGKNVNTVNSIATKKLEQPLFSSNVAKKALRLSKGTRLGAIGAGIGSLALASSAMKLDPEYKDANLVNRTTGMMFNPDSTLERYRKAYTRPLSSTTTVTLNI